MNSSECDFDFSTSTPLTKAILTVGNYIFITLALVIFGCGTGLGGFILNALAFGVLFNALTTGIC